MFTRECDYYGKNFAKMEFAFREFCRACKESMWDRKCHRDSEGDGYFKVSCFSEWALSEHTEGTSPKVTRLENEKGYTPLRHDYGVDRGVTYDAAPCYGGGMDIVRWVPILLRRIGVYEEAEKGTEIVVGVPTKLLRYIDCEYYDKHPLFVHMDMVEIKDAKAVRTLKFTVGDYLTYHLPGLVFYRGTDNLPDAVIKWFGSVNENDLVIAKVNKETGEVEKACRELFSFEQEEYEKHYEESMKNTTKPKMVHSGKGTAANTDEGAKLTAYIDDVHDIHRAFTYLAYKVKGDSSDWNSLVLWVPEKGAGLLDECYHIAEVWKHPEYYPEIDFKDEAYVHAKEFSWEWYLKRRAPNIRIVRGHGDMPDSIMPMVGEVKKEDIVVARLGDDRESIVDAVKVPCVFEKK